MAGVAIPPKKKKPDQLKTTLKALAKEGELDSSGVFTLASREAARKLGAFQLPTPHSWILVLVQAANRGNATQIRVRQRRTETRVEVEGLDAWTWQDLEPHLLGMGEQASFLAALATVLRALAGASEPHEFSLTCPDGSIIGWVDGEWHQEVPSTLLHPLSKGRTTLIYHHLPKLTTLGMLQRSRAAVAELTALYTALARDALASSVPIRCDGRVLTGVHLGGVPVGQKQRRRVAVVPFGLPSSPAITFPVPDRWTDWGDWESEVGHRFRLPGGMEPPRKGTLVCSGVALLYVALGYVGEGKHATLSLEQASSVLCWVKDGVVVGRRPLKLSGSLGVRAYVSAADLPTDLSGLALRQDEELETCFAEIRKALPEALEQLSNAAPEGLKVDAKWRPLWTKVAAGAIFAGTVVSGGTATLAGGLAVAGYMGFSAKTHRAALEVMDAQLDRELKRLPGNVARALA